MDVKKLRLVFMGTPEISAYVLNRLISDNFNVVGAISQPDKPVGRKGIIESTPVKKVCEKNNIPCFQPEKIRKDYVFIKALKPDLILTIAYGQIVPQGLLDLAKYGCLNIHGSLLPKYRGASPVQSALINCEQFTGVTLMKMIDKMDAGEMYAKSIINIEELDNTTSLLMKVAEKGYELFLENIKNIVSGVNKGEVQKEDEATFCSIIKPEQEKIDLSMSGKQIIGLIKALSDTPGAFLLIDDVKYKIYKATLLNKENLEYVSGSIVKADKDGLIFATKDCFISILEIQKEGKKRMNYKDFLNGNQNLLGKVFK